MKNKNNILINVKTMKIRMLDHFIIIIYVIMFIFMKS